MNNGLIKVNKCYFDLPEFNTFNIIGDPGCDGLGASIMSIFAKALTCIDADFSIIAGDLVPYGSKKIYENVESFINNIAVNPIFTLCGNHDTDFYCEYFGLKSYSISNRNVQVIVLDNSKREFSDHTLSFFNEALNKNLSDNIIVMFHIPPPNSFTNNSISIDQWNRLKKVYTPFKGKIRYIICGHVHSYFEDIVDEIPLIVTGGGGARIEYVSDKVERKNIKNHIVQLGFDQENRLFHRYIKIDDLNYKEELEDPQLKEYIEKAFKNETAAHFKYKLMSEIAEDRGLYNFSRLFTALSESEYYHAKNHFSVMGHLNGLYSYIQDSINNEKFEINNMYKEYLNYSKDRSHGLATYTFFDSIEAEKIHKPLLEKALECYLNDQDIPEQNYYICSSCGYTFDNGKKTSRCPVCGAPNDKIITV